MDAGYDFVPIYQKLFQMEAHSIIAYNNRGEGEIDGYDQHFAPTCVREHSYRYVYEINYEHNNYEVPNQSNHYEFVTQLPFSGLQLYPSGGRVEWVVVPPTGAIVDPSQTKGIDENGSELQEYITQIPGTTKSVEISATSVN